MDQIIKISEFIVKSFLHIWPYLIITIPLAVFINLSGASKYITKSLNRNPYISILLATAIGAFSPFCSCGVIPVITSLLIGGVPLGPVMSFWIASPSMDPEIFMLSAATVGWKMSIWRLAATFIISLSAGMATHLAQTRGFFGANILRTKMVSNVRGRQTLLDLPQRIKNFFNKKPSVQLSMVQNKPENVKMNCCVAAHDSIPEMIKSTGCDCREQSSVIPETLRKQILQESWKAFLMVAKFMLLAFFINALIKFYLPEQFITNYVSTDSPFSVVVAALIGIPFYTTNMTALPLVSGLISLGMNEGAALTFLIAGPVTTLPAMMAVWGIVKPKVFFVFLAFGLLGSVLFGYLYNLFM